MKLEGGVAVVTGAAAGTGRAIARRLAGAGARVVIADVDDERGEATARELDVAYVHADMTDPDDVRTMVDRAVAEGELRLLVNNAGGGGHVPPHFPEATPEQWGATLDLNLRGPMLATQLALRAMPQGGAVVNIASMSGIEDEPYVSPEYGAAKAGLIRFTTSLAEHRGVRVSCVVPGWIATERAPEAPIPMDTIAGAVIDLATDDGAAGRVLVIPR
jgi:NAD(P)-dependent dehydrogenase (short-subunit alcohol dehydrogenase family)